jgi:hypothetical protein
MIRRHFNPSTAAWTTLQLKYERIADGLSALSPAQQSRRLADYATDDDRFLPQSLLHLSVAEVAGLSFADVGRIPHVGLTKIRNLLELLKRVLRDNKIAGDDSSAVEAAPKSFASSVPTSGRWSQWAEALKNHPWREIAIGRVAERLGAMPRSMWRVPTGAYVDLSFDELRQLKSFGPRRIAAIAAVVESLYRSLSAVEAARSIAVVPGPACLAQIESWALDMLCRRRQFDVEELRSCVVEPLVDLMRHDLGDHVAQVASETLCLAPDLRRVGSTLASDKRASAYVRKHQIRRLIGEAISVRWPRGAIVIRALSSHVCPESRCGELQRTMLGLQALVP